MRTTDLVCNGSGFVRFGFVQPGGSLVVERGAKHNTITYAAADVMARLTGGFTDYAPKYVGFLYGSDSSPMIAEPSLTRQHTWDSIKSALSSIGGNIVVSSLSATPGISVDGSTVNYAGNAVTFNADSGFGATYPLPLSAPYYTSQLSTGNYIYQAVLLSYVNSAFIPFARVSLKEGAVYPQKPAGWQLGLTWTITYL